MFYGMKIWGTIFVTFSEKVIVFKLAIENTFIHDNKTFEISFKTANGSRYIDLPKGHSLYVCA